MKIFCWLGKHKWFSWREDANYRYCKRCWRWEKIDNVKVWRHTLNPTAMEVDYDEIKRILYKNIFQASQLHQWLKEKISQHAMQ